MKNSCLPALNPQTGAIQRFSYLGFPQPQSQFHPFSSTLTPALQPQHHQQLVSGECRVVVFGYSAQGILWICGVWFLMHVGTLSLFLFPVPPSFCLQLFINQTVSYYPWDHWSRVYIFSVFISSEFPFGETLLLCLYRYWSFLLKWVIADNFIEWLYFKYLIFVL